LADILLKEDGDHLLQENGDALLVVASLSSVGTATGAATVQAVGTGIVTATGSVTGASSVGSTYIPTFDNFRGALLNGLDSAQSEGTGWDALKASIPASAVVRTSSTVVTITLPA
jgi:hypothetical protein